MVDATLTTCCHKRPILAQMIHTRGHICIAATVVVVVVGGGAGGAGGAGAGIIIIVIIK